MKWKYDENLGFVCYDIGDDFILVGGEGDSRCNYSHFAEIIVGKYYLDIDTKPPIIFINGICRCIRYLRGDDGDYQGVDDYPVLVKNTQVKEEYCCSDPRVLFYHAKAFFIAFLSSFSKEEIEKQLKQLKEMCITSEEAVKELKTLGVSLMPTPVGSCRYEDGWSYDDWYRDCLKKRQFE